MTNPSTDFLRYRGTPFQTYILPIIPAGAALREDSSLTPDHLGKIPGKFSPDLGTWTGFYNWQRNITTRSQLERWESWQGDGRPAIAAGMRTNVICAGDFDINDEEVLNEARARFIVALGILPAAVRRRHGSPRCVLFYRQMQRVAPIHKSRLAFKIKATGELCIIEVLGEGQQVVIEGPHAKGAMHYWENDVDLIKGLPSFLANPITVQDIDRTMRELREWVENDDRFELAKLSLPTTSDRAAAVSITLLNSPHYAGGEGGQELLKRAVEAIDINAPALEGYNDWVNLLRAIKAACGGDHEFFLNTVWPWAERNAGTAEKGIEWLEAKWNSFTDSQLGADYVYGVAASFDFMEGVDRAEEIFAGQPTPREVAGTATAPEPDWQVLDQKRLTVRDREAGLEALGMGPELADLFLSPSQTQPSPTSPRPACPQSAATPATTAG
jgi:hypothetical protein